MQFDALQLILILVAGLAGGFINAIAGGGSLLTLPVLIFLGLPAAVANGTNRVAIEVQNLMAVLGYRSKGVSDLGLSIKLSIPALLGAVLGAWLAVDISEELFRPILAGVMIVVLIVILVNPTRRLKKIEAEMTPLRLIAAGGGLFLAGIFGGFIQAGVGFILLALLVGVTGMDLVKANAHKVFVIGIFTLFALGVFVIGGKVDWLLGALLSVGNGTGGWLGSRFAVTKGEKWIRAILVVAVLVMAVRLTGLIPGFS